MSDQRVEIWCDDETPAIAGETLGRAREVWKGHMAQVPHVGDHITLDESSHEVEAVHFDLEAAGGFCSSVYIRVTYFAPDPDEAK